MLRSKFDDELEKLYNQFYATGTEALSQINKTVRIFISHDRELAKEVIKGDEIVNNFEIKLEKKSLEIIASQQPVSQDLHTVITVLKASSGIERTGDHTASTAEVTIRIRGEEHLPEVEAEIKKMGRVVRDMVEEALDAYITGGEERVYEVAASDGVIDNYLRDIQSVAIESIRQQPDTIFTGKEYLQVITYLERIGDYARSICEWVAYLKTGKTIEL